MPVSACGNSRPSEWRAQWRGGAARCSAYGWSRGPPDGRAAGDRNHAGRTRGPYRAHRAWPCDPRCQPRRAASQSAPLHLLGGSGTGTRPAPNWNERARSGAPGSRHQQRRPSRPPSGTNSLRTGRSLGRLMHCAGRAAFRYPWLTCHHDYKL